MATGAEMVGGQESLPNVERFSGNAARDPEKVAREFESVFVSMMLKSMRESMSKDMFAGDGSDTFGGLFDSFMGQHIAEQGGLGLAQMILASGISPAGAATRPDVPPIAPTSTKNEHSTEQVKGIKAYQNVSNK